MNAIISEFIQAIEPNDLKHDILSRTFDRVLRMKDTAKEDVTSFAIHIPKKAEQKFVPGKYENPEFHSPKEIDLDQKYEYRIYWKNWQYFSLYELATRLEKKFNCVVVDYNDKSIDLVGVSDVKPSIIQTYIDDYMCRRTESYIEFEHITRMCRGDMIYIKKQVEQKLAELVSQYDMNHVDYTVDTYLLGCVYIKCLSPPKKYLKERKQIASDISTYIDENFSQDNYNIIKFEYFITVNDYYVLEKFWEEHANDDEETKSNMIGPITKSAHDLCAKFRQQFPNTIINYEQEGTGNVFQCRFKFHVWDKDYAKLDWIEKNTQFTSPSGKSLKHAVVYKSPKVTLTEVTEPEIAHVFYILHSKEPNDDGSDYCKSSWESSIQYALKDVEKLVQHQFEMNSVKFLATTPITETCTRINVTFKNDIAIVAYINNYLKMRWCLTDGWR